MEPAGEAELACVSSWGMYIARQVENLHSLHSRLKVWNSKRWYGD